MGGIIWLASYPKSGNTWMRAFLANLLRRSDEPASLAEISGMIPGEASRRWYGRAEAEGYDLADNTVVAELRLRLQRELARAGRPQILKTHNWRGQAFGAPLIDPAVTLASIYIVRNPLDVAVSAHHHFAATIDRTIEIMGHSRYVSRTGERVVYEMTSDWSSHVASWTDAPARPLLTVRYEDMAAKPEETFTKVAEFLDVRAGAGKVERAIRAASFERLQAEEATSGFGEKPAHAERFFRKGTVGEWRSALSREQVARLVARHRDRMAQFGYLPDTSDPEK